LANYYYDGSFDGLLTVIYMAYEDRENKMLRVNANTEQLILSLDGIHIVTDFSKARRVEKAICEKLSYNFLNNIRTCFLSYDKNKDTVIIHFKEMKDGTMFSTIEPKNNVLPILISHFKNRMKREKFTIFDSGRKMIVYYDGEKAEIFFLESLEIEWSDEEIEYSKLWKTFHKTISIKERENKKLQQSNLPKYYWKYLVEDM